MRLINRLWALPLILACLTLILGCPGQNDAQSTATPAPSTVATAATPSQTPTSSTSPRPSDAPKNATWVIDVSDSQQITDSMGIIWNYTLTFHASKPGGTSATGTYNGDAQLKIEPDFASAQAAAASEGTTLLSMLFNYHAECQALSFVVEKFTPEAYAEQLKPFSKDIPLQPLVTGTEADFFAVTGAAFNGTQEPITMTIQDDDGPKTGTGGGGGAAVTVPTEITLDGATAYIHFYGTPHPLDRAFKGTVTGDVLPS